MIFNAGAGQTNGTFGSPLRAHLEPYGRHIHSTCRPRVDLHSAPVPAGILLPVWPLGGAKRFSLTPNSSAPLSIFPVFHLPSCAPPMPLQIPPSLVGIALPVWGSAPKNEFFFDLTLIFYSTIEFPQTHPDDTREGPLSSPKIWFRSDAQFLRNRFGGQSFSPDWASALALSSGSTP